MKKKLIILLIVLDALIFWGCSTASGPLFKEVPAKKYNGKAIVYFFRNSRANRAWTEELRINQGIVLSLPNKGYHLLILDPGSYDFSVYFKSDLRATKQFVLQGDSTYYIRYKVDAVVQSVGLFSNTLRSVISIISYSRDEAIETLKKCRLIEVPGNTTGYVQIKK